MFKLTKLNLGIVLSGIYLFIFLWGLIATLIGKPDPLSFFGAAILTSPLSFLLFDAFGKFDSLSSEVGFWAIVLMLCFCAIFNAVVIYIIGYFLEKLFKMIWKFINRNINPIL